MAKKILVRAPNWLGDAVMSTPFLKRLKEKEPASEIRVLCRPSLKEIYAGHPAVAGVLELAAGESVFAAADRLKAEKFDVGYVLPNSFSSALLFALAGVPERTGYAAEFRGFLLTRALRLDERWHYARRYLGLLGEEAREPEPGELHFPSRKAGARRASLAVAPGSQAPARRWFPERFAELVNGLPEKEWPEVFLVGAPGDAAACEAVERACRRPVKNVCGKTDLAALGDLLRECAALVTNESGVMHAAWAVGTPAVVLAGPSDPRLTSPFGARVRVLQRTEVPCVPCVKNDCYRPGDDYKLCLKKIAPADVAAALAELVR